MPEAPFFVPDWQVKVSALNRDDLAKVREALRAVELPSTRRWRSVLIGARTLEDARSVSDRIEAVRTTLPPISVEIERTSRLWLILLAWGPRT